MRPQEFGSIRIHRVVELDDVPVQPTRIFPGATAEQVARGRELLDHRFIARDADILIMAIHSFVLRIGGRNILIDACNGNDKQRTLTPGHYSHMMKTDWLGNLARAGVRPEEIDLVLCTHLHGDHVGWNTRLVDGKWAPTFPNAKYLMSRIDFEHFAKLPPDHVEAPLFYESYRDSVLPVVASGQAELVETDRVVERDLDHGVWLEGAPGHTPGTIVIHARNAQGHAVFSGDVIHHPIQLGEPVLHIHGEYDSAEATRSRFRLLESCADTGAMLLPAHFAAPTVARVVTRGCALGFAFEGE